MNQIPPLLFFFPFIFHNTHFPSIATFDRHIRKKSTFPKRTAFSSCLYTMSIVDSLLLPIMNNNNSSSIHANSRFQDFNYHHHQHQFLLSPSTSNSILKNGIAAYTNNSNSSTLSSTVPGEEISTIFVVGFPENMQEREFQNMFIFSPGFEAATLKLPPTSLNSSKHDFEDDSNRKQIVSVLGI